MHDFEKALDESMAMGSFNEISDLKAVVARFESLIPQSFSNINEGSGNNWIEFYDTQGNLIILLHTHYRVAFVMSDYDFPTNEVYCIKVDGFDKADWFIYDLAVFNKKFPYMVWNEPTWVVDHRKFSLLDMRFVTE